MSLIRSKPRKGIKLTKAAKELNCSPNTMMRIAEREGFKKWRNGDGRTNPWMLLEADVLAFQLKRQGL